MSMSVGVEIGVPGVISGPSEELAVAETAIDRLPRRRVVVGDGRLHRACGVCVERRRERGESRRDALREVRSIVGLLRRGDGWMQFVLGS
jgi:hypothetical protein